MSNSEDFEGSSHEDLNQNSISKQFLDIVSGAEDLPTSAEADELSATLERAHKALHENSAIYAHAVNKMYDFHKAGLTTHHWTRIASGAAQAFDAAHKTLGGNLIMRASIPDLPEQDYHFCSRCGEGFPHINDLPAIGDV